MKNILTILMFSLMITSAYAATPKAKDKAVKAKADIGQQAAAPAKDTAKKEEPVSVKEVPAAAAAKKAEVKEENISDSQSIIDNFVAWDKKLKTLKTDYTQTTSFEGVPISSSKGRLYKKDNNIRLDTLTDNKVSQTAVTDKEIIKIYDDKGKEITYLSWEIWESQQPNKALFDFGNYSAVVKSHELKEAKKTGNGYSLTFVSKTDSGEYQLDFVLSADYFPSEITISSEGIKTATVLTDINKNLTIQESVFK